MLSEQAQFLLSGFIDGVLSRDERKEAERLLRDSSEARAWVRKLQDNAARLKKLTRVNLEKSFTGDIMAQVPPLPLAPPVVPVPVVPIAVVPVPVVPEPVIPAVVMPAPDASEPIVVAKPRLRRGMPRWLVGMLAASVVAAIIGGTAWYLREHVEVDRSLLPGQPAVAQQKERKAPAKAEPASSPVEQVAKGANKSPAPSKSEAVARPSPRPLHYLFGELKDDGLLDALKWELKQQQAVHVDVQVAYNARSLNRLIEAFDRNGVHLTLTPAAQASVKKKETLLVYAENVRSDALAQSLQDLAQVDVQGTTQQPSTYEALTVRPESPEDAKSVAKGLGIDAEKLKKSGAAAAKGASRGVILSPQTPANGSRETKEFLDSRQAPTPGTIRVYLRLVPQ